MMAAYRTKGKVGAKIDVLLDQKIHVENRSMVIHRNDSLALDRLGIG